MSTPRATVRLQLHSGFTFDDAAAAVDYYARLGISHVYTSPVFAAREGSAHGYDVVDPARINPELGGEAGLLRLVEALRAANMGLIIDIVPNHMGVASGANRYWQDVLAWGARSRYAGWFDINWDAPEPHLKNKLLLPVLGQPRDTVLRAGDLGLQLDADQGRLWLTCYGQRLPLSAASHAAVFAEHSALHEVAQTFLTATPESLERACSQLADLARSAVGMQALEQAVARYSAATVPGQQALQGLMDEQHYRLSWWRNAAEEINWRRFFEVSELAGVRVERDEVFEATHALVFELYARGLIDGVRVDHVDGLAEPGAYCRKLRKRLKNLQAQRPAALRSGGPWIVVEKILSPGEALPGDWGVDGTTGYEFMDQAAAVLHDGEGERALRALWCELTADRASFEAHLQMARKQLLAENFAGEVDALARALHAHAESAPLGGRDVALPAIRRVTTALLACFRRYRCYNTADSCSDIDRQVLELARDHARRHLRTPDHALLDSVAGWLGLDSPSATDSSRGTRQRALTRFQQLTPPLAAKSMEDTVFYRHTPLLSRNEVGSYPAQVAAGPLAFHAANVQRAADFPRSLLATATHDHKRGEDTRARLAVLSDIPAEWETQLRKWMHAHEGLRATLPQPGGGLLAAPRPGTEIMLYQALLGAWPPSLAASDADGISAFGTRMAAWLEKALREAKLESSWMLPDTAYEAACQSFLKGLLASERFISDMAQLVLRMAPATAANSLTQTLLRLTAPGVPDLYQGTEFADFSLVDPDNRRPVDLAARRSALQQRNPGGADAPADDGGLHQKQHLIRKALEARQRNPDLFCGGDYLPLGVLGQHSRHVLAFARRSGAACAVVVALRHPAQLYAASPQGGVSWQDTSISLEAGFPRVWRDVLAGTELQTSESALRLADVLPNAAVALLLAV
ncbi:MAG: malto-oligosyltrehalose synthase [Polaromonas sp.]|nr:malto-oligosyltrehalose synthase [Polaromonas sp.]